MYNPKIIIPLEIKQAIQRETVADDWARAIPKNNHIHTTQTDFKPHKKGKNNERLFKIATDTRTDGRTN